MMGIGIGVGIFLFGNIILIMSEPVDLDVVIIACDNERTIARTLLSVEGYAKRILVIDSGSRDGTMEIARKHGAEVIYHEWEGHVKQKQFALEQCSAAWVLSLDSDESVDEVLRGEILRVVGDDESGVAGFEVNRRIFFLGRWLKYTFQPEWRLRLVRRERAHWEGYDPHDKMVVEGGGVRRLGGVLRHDSWADVSDLVRSQVGHGLHAAESYHQMGRRGSLLKLFISPAGAMFKQLVLRRGVLDGWRGVVVAVGASVGVCAKYLRLIEIGRVGESGDGDTG